MKFAMTVKFLIALLMSLINEVRYLHIPCCVNVKQIYHFINTSENFLQT